MTAKTLQQYEADEVIDCLLDLKSLLIEAGYGPDSDRMESIERALSALGYAERGDDEEEDDTDE